MGNRSAGIGRVHGCEASDQVSRFAFPEARHVETLATPAGQFEQVLKVEETTPLEPLVIEYKYYAKGVGVVLEEVIEGGSERVELVSVDGG